jgi:hypothetical protein
MVLSMRMLVHVKCKGFAMPGSLASSRGEGWGEEAEGSFLVLESCSSRIVMPIQNSNEIPFPISTGANRLDVCTTSR